MKPQKPEVKSSVIYFQIGLIVSLLMVIFLINHQTPEMSYSEPGSLAFENAFSTKATRVHLPEKNRPEKHKTKKTHRPKKKKPTTSTVVKNPFLPDDNSGNNSNKKDDSDPVFTPTAKGPIDYKPIEPYPFVKVEQPPIFPGCEIYGTRKERAACFSEKVERLVKRYYNSQLAEKLGLSGVQNIYVAFTVDETGELTDIKARSVHQALADEAVRVVKKIPRLTPAHQQNKNVPVRYNLPIRFEVK